MKIPLLICLVLMTTAAPAFAQSEARAQEEHLVLGPDFERRFDELAAWLKEYQAWEKWFEVWGNRVARNFDDQPLWERPVRPAPPVWLYAECQDDWVGDGGPIATACHILRHWDEEPLLILQRRGASLVTTGGKVNDQVVKSTFFQRVHLTGLWVRARYPAPSAYGVVGMQIGVFETGRFTLPAIGAMVVLIPDGEGGHSLKPATTMGFGYRLLDFVPPMMKTQVSLHLNVARVQVLGVQDAQMLPGMSSVNLLGFSVSRKRRR